MRSMTGVRMEERAVKISKWQNFPKFNKLFLKHGRLYCDLNFRAYSTFAERFKKILKIHPGFDQLSEQEQVRFL
jgi:hypothetical protein